MLYRLHTNMFIIGLLTLGFLSVLAANRAFCAITPVTIFAYITQLALLIWFSREDRVSYSEKELFLVVLFYGFLIGGLIIVVSNYYNGEEFLFEDPDAALYYREGMKSVNIGILENMKRYLVNHPFTDWGALTFSSVMLSIIPSFYFVNAIYILLGAIASVLLFRIGKHVMPEAYAYLASLSYSTSSYLILFHCTFLKESLFILLVICVMYYFYKSVIEGNNGALFWVLIFVILVAFFRTAVVAFLLASLTAYYAVTQRGSALSLFLYGIIGIGLLASMAYLQTQMEFYTAGGDRDVILAESGSSNYSGGFNFFVGWFAALFGPFPTLFPTEALGPVTMNFYGAGLVSKLFLAIPIWIGVFMAVKHFDILMIPLVVFVVIEVGASAYVMASLELRKVMLHVPFTYILSFYGLYQLERRDVSTFTKQLLEVTGNVMTVGILLLWNVIRVKG